VSTPAFTIQRRYGVFVKGLVLVILTGFALGSGIVTVAVWRAGLLGWGILMTLLTLGLLFALVMFTHRYLVRGVAGHYLTVGPERLTLGELEGRIVHDVALADIRQVAYDHGNMMATRVALRDGSAVRLNTLEIHPEEFEELAAVLAVQAPAIKVERA